MAGGHDVVVQEILLSGKYGQIFIRITTVNVLQL